MYKTRIKEKWWFSQCGRTNPSWTPLCDFKYRPWDENSSPNSNDLYIHYMDKSTGTPPSLEEKRTLPNCGNKDGNIIHVLKNWICNSFEVYEMTEPICTHISLVFGDEFLSQGLYLKSHRGVQLGLDLLGWVPTKYITFKRPKPEKRSLLKQHIEVDHIQ